MSEDGRVSAWASASLCSCLLLLQGPLQAISWPCRQPCAGVCWHRHDVEGPLASQVKRAEMRRNAWWNECEMCVEAKLARLLAMCVCVHTGSRWYYPLFERLT